MTDQAFLGEARTSRLRIDPMRADEMEVLFRHAYASPPLVVERAKELLKRTGK